MTYKCRSRFVSPRDYVQYTTSPSINRFSLKTKVVPVGGSLDPPAFASSSFMLLYVHRQPGLPPVVDPTSSQTFTGSMGSSRTSERCTQRIQSAETGGGFSVVVQTMPTLRNSLDGGTAVQKYTLFFAVLSLASAAPAPPLPLHWVQMI